MVQAARDARLLRSLLMLDPPRGVQRSAWRRYLATRAAPIVHQVLADLKQPIAGPTAKPEDLDERAAPEATPAARMSRKAPPPSDDVRGAALRIVQDDVNAAEHLARAAVNTSEDPSEIHVAALRAISVLLASTLETIDGALPAGAAP